jgi:hypothetical protein
MKRSFLLLSVLLLIIVAANAQDSTQRKDYLGKYKFPEGSVVPEVEVLIENGMLMMNSSAGTSSLELIKGDTFTIVAFNGTAAFKRNDAKKVIGVHIDAGGYILDGVKDSTTTMKSIVRNYLYQPGTEVSALFKPVYISNPIAGAGNIITRSGTPNIPGTKSYFLTARKASISL